MIAAGLSFYLRAMTHLTHTDKNGRIKTANVVTADVIECFEARDGQWCLKFLYGKDYDVLFSYPSFGALRDDLREQLGAKYMKLIGLRE